MNYLNKVLLKTQTCGLSFSKLQAKHRSILCKKVHPSRRWTPRPGPGMQLARAQIRQEVGLISSASTHSKVLTLSSCSFDPCNYQASWDKARVLGPRSNTSPHWIDELSQGCGMQEPGVGAQQTRMPNLFGDRKLQNHLLRAY